MDVSFQSLKIPEVNFVILFPFLKQIIHTTSVHGEAIHKRAGDTLRLECQVDGIPPPSIVWYKVSQGAYICTLKSQASYYSHNGLKDFENNSANL